MAAIDDEFDDENGIDDDGVDGFDAVDGMVDDINDEDIWCRILEDAEALGGVEDGVDELKLMSLMSLMSLMLLMLLNVDADTHANAD